ncbi:zinc finger domain-containing protein [Streptomyces hygroscopicus]|uniref:zinc finger domain-containing protein n=1 Tax=Streptomyces hygroscopicus TaxID=1912 RepID=UPI0037B697DA
MNPDETVMLARYVRALCPQQKFDEYTADAWYDLLAPYTLEEARAAVARHIAAGHAFVAVGEIVTEIRKARNDRLERHTEAEPPDGDLGDHASYQAALLAERRAIASGHTQPRPVPALPPGTTEQPTGRARAILAAVGDTAPGPREGVVNVLAVACPRCHARPGRTCTTNGRRRADVHPARLEDARRAAAGLPPAPLEDAEAEIQRRIAASRAALAALPPGTVPQPNDGFEETAAS